LRPAGATVGCRCKLERISDHDSAKHFVKQTRPSLPEAIFDYERRLGGDPLLPWRVPA
jgi:hypothetical protein